MSDSTTILSKDAAELQLEKCPSGYLLTCLEDGFYNAIEIYLNKNELIKLAQNILDTVNKVD